MRYCLLIFVFLCFAADASADVLISKIVLRAQSVSDEPLPHGRVFVDPMLATRAEATPLRAQLRTFIGTPLTLEQCEVLKKTISDFFFEHLHLLTVVSTPTQEISSGVLQIQVDLSTLDEVTLEGNKWTSNRWLLARTHLQTGKELHTDRLETDLAWLNRSPFRRTDLVLLPGSKPHTTSAKLITQERFPLRPYIGGDNTGTSHTSYTRWFAGLQAGNIWEWDQQASYQFTTASDPFKFIAHNATYTIPFPWHHQLYTYGGWSRTNGTLPEKSLRHRCINWQVSPRYQIPISPLYGKKLQEFTIGYDFKQIDNALAFSGTSFSHATADINQIMIGYSFRYQTPRFATSFTLEAFAAPAQLTQNQTDTQYQKIRPFAASRYGYLRIQCDHTQNFPHAISLYANLVAQGTAWNLLPSEQMGIGGYNTVRGYEERGMNADNALLASLEIKAPPIKRLQFLAFIDYGWGELYHADVDQKPTDWMLGFGPGVRYFNSDKIAFRADLGFPLHPAGIGRQGIHLHVGGSLAF